MASIADLIEKHHDAIIQRWLEQAAKAASARGLTGPELSNMMPVYLSSLCKSASMPTERPSRQRELVENHIGSRLRHGFDLAEIVAEFGLLGRCVSQIRDTLPPAEQPEHAELEWLFGELQLATLTVAEVFHKHMREGEQTEKRYMRLLRSLANEALRTPATPLRERLRDVMTLVMEALDAQTAAILLYDPQTHQLVMTAAVGAANGELERYVTAVDPSSFAGKTAAREEPTSIPDAETTELDVGDDLRGSGIHGLLGVRLPPRFKLVGVMYVGTTEKRTFTAQEGWRLESLAEQLTLHLDNAQLYKDLLQQAEALRSERDLREQFVSVLAHDLRGPLSSVKVAAQLLLRQPERLGKRRDLASRIDRNIQRMDQMIRDLLDASRVHIGEQLPLRLDLCDLGVVAGEVIEELRQLHGDRFVVDAERGVRGFWSAEELRRALWNLATNAMKYGEQDRPITLTVRRRQEGAWVSVHNEGAVIPPEDQTYLFEPFSRGRSAPDSGREGWGLGLFLVRACAEAHGGKVRVQSDAATGTTFTMELPLDARPYQPRGTEALAQETAREQRLH